MNQNTDISQIRLSASANFYKIKNNDRSVDAASWEDVAKKIKKSFHHNRNDFFKTEWIELPSQDEYHIHYGLCVFRLPESKPTFAKNIEDYWTERKLGYVIIVEYSNFVVIQARNMAIPTSFLADLELIKYDTLTTLNNNSTYSKISMKNLEGGINAMRARTFIADNLAISMPHLGAHHYALTAFNGRNDRGKIFSVTTSTARIAERAQNLSIDEYCMWAKDTVIRLNVPTAQTDLLSIFAEYIDYKTENKNNALIPSSLLLSPWAIVEKLEETEYDFYYNHNGHTRHITLNNVMSHLKKLTNTPIILSLSDNMYVDATKHITVKVNNEGITIAGDKLDKVSLNNQENPQQTETLSQFINKLGLFNVYFTNNSVVYTQNGLFKNNDLHDSKDILLKTFKPLDGLGGVGTEKHHGDNFQGLASWSEDSIFLLVENNFQNNFDYFICDDCEQEWADHIGISADKITFFVEKHNDSKTSASAFQDAIGQALKNLGYLTPTDASFNSKRIIWEGNHTTSNIPRLRKHPEEQHVHDAINLWKKNRQNPLCQKEMCLVVNFISLNEFTQNLNRIDNLDNIVLKTTTLQRLWFLSSFVNTCLEVGVTPKIYCAP